MANQQSIRFLHNSLRDFFAADFLHRPKDEEWCNLLDEKVQAYQIWAEPLHLMAGLLDRDKLLKLIQWCQDWQTNPYGLDHLAEHLREVGDTKWLYGLVENPQFLALKYRRNGLTPVLDDIRLAFGEAVQENLPLHAARFLKIYLKQLPLKKEIFQKVCHSFEKPEFCSEIFDDFLIDLKLIDNPIIEASLVILLGHFQAKVGNMENAKKALEWLVTQYCAVVSGSTKQRDFYNRILEAVIESTPENFARLCCERLSALDQKVYPSWYWYMLWRRSGRWEDCEQCIKLIKEGDLGLYHGLINFAIWHGRWSDALKIYPSVLNTNVNQLIFEVLIRLVAYCESNVLQEFLELTLRHPHESVGWLAAILPHLYIRDSSVVWDWLDKILSRINGEEALVETYQYALSILCSTLVASPEQQIIDYFQALIRRIPQDFTLNKISPEAHDSLLHRSIRQIITIFALSGKSSSRLDDFVANTIKQMRDSSRKELVEEEKRLWRLTDWDLEFYIESIDIMLARPNFSSFFETELNCLHNHTLEAILDKLVEEFSQAMPTDRATLNKALKDRWGRWTSYQSFLDTISNRFVFGSTDEQWHKAVFFVVDALLDEVYQKNEVAYALIPAFEILLSISDRVDKYFEAWVFGREVLRLEWERRYRRLIKLLVGETVTSGRHIFLRCAGKLQAKLKASRNLELSPRVYDELTSWNGYLTCMFKNLPSFIPPILKSVLEWAEQEDKSLIDVLTSTTNTLVFAPNEAVLEFIKPYAKKLSQSTDTLDFINRDDVVLLIADLAGVAQEQGKFHLADELLGICFREMESVIKSPDLAEKLIFYFEKEGNTAWLERCIREWPDKRLSSLACIHRLLLKRDDVRLLSEFWKRYAESTTKETDLQNVQEEAAQYLLDNHLGPEDFREALSLLDRYSSWDYEYFGKIASWIVEGNRLDRLDELFTVLKNEYPDRIASLCKAFCEAALGEDSTNSNYLLETAITSSCPPDYIRKITPVGNWKIIFEKLLILVHEQSSLVTTIEALLRTSLYLNSKELMEIAQKFAERLPGKWLALCARVAIKIGEMNQAKAMIACLLDADSDTWDTHSLALVLVEFGDEAFLQRFLQNLSPSPVDSWKLLAVILERLEPMGEEWGGKVLSLVINHLPLNQPLRDEEAKNLRSRWYDLDKKTAKICIKQREYTLLRSIWPLVKENKYDSETILGAMAEVAAILKDDELIKETLARAEELSDNQESRAPFGKFAEKLVQAGYPCTVDFIKRTSEFLHRSNRLVYHLAWVETKAEHSPLEEFFELWQTYQDEFSLTYHSKLRAVEALTWRKVERQNALDICEVFLREAKEEAEAHEQGKIFDTMLRLLPDRLGFVSNELDAHKGHPSYIFMLKNFIDKLLNEVSSDDTLIPTLLNEIFVRLEEYTAAGQEVTEFVTELFNCLERTWNVNNSDWTSALDRAINNWATDGKIEVLVGHAKNKNSFQTAYRLIQKMTPGKSKIREYIELAELGFKQEGCLKEAFDGAQAMPKGQDRDWLFYRIVDVAASVPSLEPIAKAALEQIEDEELRIKSHIAMAKHKDSQSFAKIVFKSVRDEQEQIELLFKKHYRSEGESVAELFRQTLGEDFVWNKGIATLVEYCLTQPSWTQNIFKGLYQALQGEPSLQQELCEIILTEA